MTPLGPRTSFRVNRPAASVPPIAPFPFVSPTGPKVMATSGPSGLPSSVSRPTTLTRVGPASWQPAAATSRTAHGTTRTITRPSLPRRSAGSGRGRHLAVGDGRQPLEQDRVGRLGEEPDRPVAEADVGPAGVQATDPGPTAQRADRGRRAARDGRVRPG